ncbi:protein unc-13 homolog isoform X2 [Rhodamnia argentea]|uniref:Protein unc-13 homolog isoform X2 n=1 Tax=Rhodamnia argentea TaxID=178133 RepID=A0ABM3H5U1_9MYRT|nr:protein unc-13 homolog isoform X2 [Rhodamnia argentea]
MITSPTRLPEFLVVGRTGAFMDGPMEPPLLHRYRRDRRKLLEFLLSSAGLDCSSLSRADFDTLSADYVIRRLQSGGPVDVAAATEKYFDESTCPIMIHSPSKNSYFLVSDPELAGSPPQRMPPQADVAHSPDHASTSLGKIDTPLVWDTEDHVLQYKETHLTPMKPVDSEVPPLGLPVLIAGLSDDDLQESAYEVLLASMVFSGIELHTACDRKKEKNSKFFSGIKGKKNKIHFQSQPHERHFELIDIIRSRMQISEAKDACIRKKLIELAATKTCRQINIPQISLGLLGGIHESDFLNEKHYFQWRKRQVNLLEEFISSSPNHGTNEHHMVRSSLLKIRDPKEWDVKMSPSDRTEVLYAIRLVVLGLSSLPGEVGLETGTSDWTVGYQLNIRIYEKLLFGMFDILDESQLIEEAEEILDLIKMTWPTLGITQKIHDAMHGWVLFRQFVGTHEPSLLEHSILKLQRFVSAEDHDRKKEQYIDRLECSQRYNGVETKLSLVESILCSISIWCDSRLQDYHLHFSKEPDIFGRVMMLVSLTGVPIINDSEEIKLLKLNASDGNVILKFSTYVERSIEAAYTRVASTINLESKLAKTHGLALLANELNLLAKREFSIFYPVMRNWYPEAGAVSATKLKKYYGERLQPYLAEVSYLTEDVRSVLSAANALDYDLSELYTSICEENKLNHLSNHTLDRYQIEEVAGPVILDWIIAQHSRILQWTERQLDLEKWEALSFQQRQAPSVVEVFRIVEETVDQFFGWNLPMNITHLQALLSVIFHSLDTYLSKVSNGLVEKKDLLPSAPPLTRYTETVIPIIKRKVVENTPTDNGMNDKLTASTISKLCIRLNTLQYIKKNSGILEDSLRKSWALVRSSKYQRSVDEPLQNTVTDCLTYDEAVDELFSTTFNSIRDTSTNAIGTICDLIGLRMVFWDLRDKVLSCLYCGNVESARLDKFLFHFDTVLNRICGLLDESLRDLVALSVYRASMDAFVWVLLDGGPSRAFSEADVSLLEDDFTMLKEFFIADGEGLPRSLVEKEAEFAAQILQLFSLKTDTVIQMLLNSSQRISSGLHAHRHGRIPDDAYILIRVLCHKKDREASKFLKRQYQLPMSSEYDDTPSKDSAVGSTFMSDILERSSSFHWTEKGQKSLSSFKKKIQEATSELRHGAW